MKTDDNLIADLMNSAKGVWHMVDVHEASAIVEMKNGKYIPLRHKGYIVKVVCGYCQIRYW